MVFHFLRLVCKIRERQLNFKWKYNMNKNTMFSMKVGPIMTIRSCQVPVRHKTVKAHNVVKIFLKEYFNFIRFYAPMFSMKCCLNSNPFLDLIFHRFFLLICMKKNNPSEKIFNQLWSGWVIQSTVYTLGQLAY